MDLDINSMPEAIKPEHKIEEFERVRILYRYRNHAQTAIIWTLYVFQLSMALLALYRTATETNSDWVGFWSVSVMMLCSLFVISWVDKNIIYKDDLDG